MRDNAPNNGNFLVLGDMTIGKLLAIADTIDAEHYRRMQNCARETKRAYSRYIRSITAEYDFGHKRKRWAKALMVQEAESEKKGAE